MSNTFSKGRVRVLVYKEKDENIWYATALEFNLTVDADDKVVAMVEIQQAIKDYLTSARELNDSRLLNQDPDPELVELWGVASALQLPEQEPIKSPYIPVSAFVENILEEAF